MQLAVPLPAVCLQLVTAEQKVVQVEAALQVCRIVVELVAVVAQVPAPQFCVDVAVAPAVTWQELELQFWVTVAPVTLAWQDPEAQFCVPVPPLVTSIWQLPLAQVMVQVEVPEQLSWHGCPAAHTTVQLELAQFAWH